MGAADGGFRLVGLVSRTWVITAPEIGDMAARPELAKALSGTPRRLRMARASSAAGTGTAATDFRAAWSRADMELPVDE